MKRCMGSSRIAIYISFLAAFAPAAPLGVVPPGDAFECPALQTASGAPQIYEHSQEAGPDETLFLVGTNLTQDVWVWGSLPGRSGGGPVRAKVQLATDAYLALTIPDSACDGPMAVAVRNGAGYSAPVAINAPAPWWCAPACAVPGEPIRVFGRNLARRPDFRRAFVYLCKEGQAGRWIDASDAGKYAVSFVVPKELAPGTYEVWLHAGRGGAWGWGGPVRLEVQAREPSSRIKTLRPGKEDALALQEALDAMAARGGGTVKLSAGRFPFTGTLRVPPHVTLAGAGQHATTLELQPSPAVAFAHFCASGWNLAPGAIHSQCDAMTYEIDVPQYGTWTVWLRYATDMSPWNQPGVSGNTAVQIDGGLLRTLENLPNTGGFGVFKWSRSAALEIPAGKHTLLWRNVKGGGLSLDAFVLTRDPADAPGDAPWPTNSSSRMVIQGEDCTRFETKEGQLPGSERAAVWLSGDGAAIEALTVLGNAQVSQGVAIRAAAPTAWVSGCAVKQVTVADCEGKQAENCGLCAHHLRRGVVRGNELWGRTPLFLSGARQSVFADNRLVSVTRFGGNSEAAILGRCEPIEECVIENNTVASPPGATAGGPTARRLLWFSTGHGSVAHNWIANNGVEADGEAGQARFGGVAGTDQNVGETILFEGNHRTMYFGPLAGADEQGVTLPATLPATPDDRLGSVKREQLAHDADGRETPFWPPAVDDASDEPVLGEYYATIFSGPGQGQTRRVVGRKGERLAVESPWRVVPQAGSVVAVGTMFYQNLVVGNHTPDGMTGIQLWISCVENIVSGNTIARQRKPGLFLYANGTTLASSMPRTWNRGISPLFWNLAEGNRTDECSDGALVTSGDEAGLPIDFPRALGNVLRHNSFVRSRHNGVIVCGRGVDLGGRDRSAPVVGTVVELNVVRDAPTAYHAASGSDAVVFRRDHAYFWESGLSAPVAFAIDAPTTRFAIEENSVEGKNGVGEASIREVRKGWEK